MTNINIDGSNYKVEPGERLIDIGLGADPSDDARPLAEAFAVKD